jgi:hypothetical protein
MSPRSSRLEELEGQVNKLEEQIELIKRDRRRLARHMNMMGKAIERILYGKRILLAIATARVNNTSADAPAVSPQFRSDVARAMRAIKERGPNVLGGA